MEIDTHPNTPNIIQARKINFAIDELSLVAHGTRRDGLYALLLPAIGVPLLKWRMTSRWKMKLGLKIKQLNAELCQLRHRLGQEEEQVAGPMAPRASTQLISVLFERLQELRSTAAESKLKERNAIRAYRRRNRNRNRPNSSPRRGSDTDATGDSDGDGDIDTSEDEQQPAGPGEPDRGPFKKFKISFSLKDAILPNLTADAAESLLYRRERAETNARRAPRCVEALRTPSNAGWCSATSTGIHRGNPAGRPWRSPVFSLNS